MIQRALGGLAASSFHLKAPLLFFCSLQVTGGEPRQKDMGKPLKVAESDVDVSDKCTSLLIVFLCA